MMRGRAGLLLLMAVLLACGAAAVVAINQVGVTPRVLAPYIKQRTSGHNPALVALGRQTGDVLLRLDRGAAGPSAANDLAWLTLGAQPQPAGADRPAGLLVTDARALRAAMGSAAPGAVITLAPGTYSLGGRPLEANHAGAQDALIVVRAALPGSVDIVSTVSAAFKVGAPYWRFENLGIHGACRRDGDCEHAFHVFGAAIGFAAVNNTIEGFNAHFKINGSGGRFPDSGLIEANTLYNRAPRATDNPVTPVDLVAASGWTIRANIIRDFVKLQGNKVSYGAFAKGGGSGNVFERNLIWCERELAGQPGQRVGLSLGGGGTGRAFCRDGRCITEQDGGVVRANLIVGCSDAGIYLNSAANSRIEDNTLVDTGGIDVRFATSSAALDGNLVDGAIRARDDAVLRSDDNRDSALWLSFTGYHPVRSLFAAPGTGDFSWARTAPLRPVPRMNRVDLCGGPRRAAYTYGAFEDANACRRP